MDHDHKRCTLLVVGNDLFSPQPHDQERDQCSTDEEAREEYPQAVQVDGYTAISMPTAGDEQQGDDGEEDGQETSRDAIEEDQLAVVKYVQMLGSKSSVRKGFRERGFDDRRRNLQWIQALLDA